MATPDHANHTALPTDRNILAPVYSWFTEDFDFLSLKDAMALLDELS